MPPPARNLAHASQAAWWALAPLCITPQMSTIQASHWDASCGDRGQDRDGRNGHAASLEQIDAERKAAEFPLPLFRGRETRVRQKCDACSWLPLTRPSPRAGFYTTPKRHGEGKQIKPRSA